MPEQDPYLVALGAVIRRRREKLGMTQDALATACNTSQRRIYDWEHGLRDLRIVGSLRPLAAALRLTIVELLVAADVELADQAAELAVG